MKLLGISRSALLAGLIGAGAMGTLILGPQFQDADARPIVLEAPVGAPLSFADLIEQVSPAVVGVRVRTEVQPTEREKSERERLLEQFGLIPRDEEPEPREGFGQGSGFFISEEGHIVTNHHVVDDAVEIEVILDDGTSLDAEIVGTDRETDLAVLKVKDAGKYEYVDFGASTQLRRGDWVVAIGNPLGFSGTATAGIVSAIGKPGDFQRSRSYTDFLQIDAAINRGNSGGPTFNMNGQVVGVNSWIASNSGGSIGLGFAIPAELVDDVTQTLISEGKVSRGYLGVLIGNVTEDIATAIGLDEPNGAIVSSVTKDGPADKSGLERGDIITKVNGTSVSDATTTTRLVGALAAGSRNKFEVLRDGKAQVINVTVGERPDNLGQTTTVAPDTEDDSEGKEGPLGVTLRPLDKETREKMNLGSGETGMIITELDNDSVLYKEGMRVGMAILDVNYKKLDSLSVLEKELDEARSSGRNRLLMAVHTGNGTVFIAVDVSEDD